MHKIRIGKSKIEYEVPARWEELTADQLEFLARLSLNGSPVWRICLMMALYCIGAKVVPGYHIWPHRKDLVKLMIGNKYHYVGTEYVAQLGALFSWLVTKEEKEGTPTYKILANVDKCPYPHIQVKDFILDGPADGMLDICFEQYMYIHTFVQQMQHDPTKITYVIACVWHSGERWDIERLEQDAALIARLSDDKKIVMMWFIQSALIFFSDKFPRLFGGAKSKGGNAFDYQMRLLDSLADGDMTKKDAVRRGSLMDAFYSMDEAVRKKEEMERKR